MFSCTNPVISSVLIPFSSFLTGNDIYPQSAQGKKCYRSNPKGMCCTSFFFYSILLFLFWSSSPCLDPTYRKARSGWQWASCACTSPSLSPISRRTSSSNGRPPWRRPKGRRVGRARRRRRGLVRALLVLTVGWALTVIDRPRR
jgi:hypothetical protein